MIAGMNKSGKYGAELKFSVKSMDVMKVMVKSDSKSSNDALRRMPPISRRQIR